MNIREALWSRNGGYVCPTQWRCPRTAFAWSLGSMARIMEWMRVYDLKFCKSIWDVK